VQQPAEFIPKVNPDVVHVTFKNNARVTLTEPRVSGDSLFGIVRGLSAPLAAPLDHIQRVDAKQRDKARTTWLIAGITAVTAAAVVALANPGSSTYHHPCARQREDCDYSVE
jgi:hypothetical protein